MPDQPKPSSSAQASSSNTPASSGTYKRTGKVSSAVFDHYRINDVFGIMNLPYILILANDKKGPLKDEEGRNTKPTVRVENKILDEAIEDNKKKMVARGEEIDETHPEPYLFQIGNIISLEYTDDRLTAIEKIA